jgi:CDGSH-type Zn-finger protein
VSDVQVTITPLENGPNLVQGNVRIIGPDGREMEHPASIALCRCGGSANKPFCDGTHRRNGFQAAGAKSAPRPS